MAEFDDLYGWESEDDEPLDVYEQDAREHLRPF